MSGASVSNPASFHGRAKSLAVMAILALIPLVGWLTWQGLGGIRPSALPSTAGRATGGVAEQANATLAQTPTGAGQARGSQATASSTPPVVATATAGTASPAESASQAQGPKGAVLIKGLGFLTIDDPADKSEPPRLRDEGHNSKPKPAIRVSERPAAVPKGVDPCQDINRKLSTQDPTPEDIAFLKRGCR